MLLYCVAVIRILGFSGGAALKWIHLPMQETWVHSLGREGPLEEGMAIHSSILAWRLPWAEETGGLKSMGPQRVKHD